MTRRALAMAASIVILLTAGAGAVLGVATSSTARLTTDLDAADPAGASTRGSATAGAGR